MGNEEKDYTEVNYGEIMQEMFSKLGVPIEQFGLSMKKIAQDFSKYGANLNDRLSKDDRNRGWFNNC